MQHTRTFGAVGCSPWGPQRALRRPEPAEKGVTMSRQSVAKAHQKIQELAWEPKYHEPVAQYGTDYTFHKAQKKDPLKAGSPVLLPDAGIRPTDYETVALTT